MAAEVEDRLSHRLQDAQKQDQHFITAAVEAADRIQSAIAQAISRGTIAADDLFDTEYREVPDTNPTQYTTRFLTLLESILPEYQEPVLALDDRVVFCAAVDRNGYLPVHNRKYWRRSDRMTRSGTPPTGTSGSSATAPDCWRRDLFSCRPMPAIWAAARK
jgi:methyl-accepting chemotaxis protein